jgi:signal transduction histidine kinase
MMRILPYRTKLDRIDGIVITFMNITGSKRTQDDLERARGELETKVAERTGDLEQANQSLWLEVSERRQSEVVRLKLLNQLVTAQEGERRRLARDLHDQLGQQLTALRLKLASLKGQSPKGEKLHAQVDELLAITGQLDTDVDFLAWELRPVALDDLGLAAALSNYVTQWAEHFSIAAQFHVTGLKGRRLSTEIENNLYRIAQEALNNVAKHAKASRVEVLLEHRDHHAVLIIEDNGLGFDVANESGSDETMGITSMRERATLIGGTLEIESMAGKGTSVFVRIQLSNGVEETLKL